MPLPNGYSKFRMGGLACLYKGTDTAPDKIFGGGWPVKVGDIDIANHLLNKGKGSCWWSTSLDKFASALFGRYVYRIVGLNDMAIVANEAYCVVKKKGFDQVPFREQAEMSVYSVIPPDCIAGVFDGNDNYSYRPNLASRIPMNTATWIWPE